MENSHKLSSLKAKYLWYSSKVFIVKELRNRNQSKVITLDELVNSMENNVDNTGNTSKYIEVSHIA